MHEGVLIFGLTIFARSRKLNIFLIELQDRLKHNWELTDDILTRFLLAFDGNIPLLRPGAATVEDCLFSFSTSDARRRLQRRQRCRKGDVQRPVHRLPAGSDSAPLQQAHQNRSEPPGHGQQRAEGSAVRLVRQSRHGRLRYSRIRRRKKPGETRTETTSEALPPINCAIEMHFKKYMMIITRRT